MKELNNNATYTIKLTRREIIRLSILITMVSDSPDMVSDSSDMGQGFDLNGYLNIRDKLRQQYRAEDKKRMKD